MLNGEPRDTYDGSVESASQAPRSSVVVEQLHPAGRILQINELPKVYEVFQPLFNMCSYEQPFKYESPKYCIYFKSVAVFLKYVDFSIQRLFNISKIALVIIENGTR